MITTFKNKFNKKNYKTFTITKYQTSFREIKQDINEWKYLWIKRQIPRGQYSLNSSINSV